MSRIYIILLLCVSATAQAQSYKKVARMAQTAFEQQQYNNALALTTQLLTTDSLNTKYLYVAGMSAYELREYANATQRLQSYISLVTKKEAKLAYYALAQCYEAKQAYKQALKMYKKQITVNPKKLNNTYEYKLCQQRIVSCEYVLGNKEKNIKKIAQFADSAYTKYSELYPNFIDSSHLLLARLDTSPHVNNYVQHNATSTLVANGIVNISYNSALTYGLNAVGYNTNTNELVVAHIDTLVLQKNNVDWLQTNSSYTQIIQPCIALINDTLRIIYSAENGNNRELYWSTLNTNNKITPPISITSINTVGNEITPFYSQYDSALYYSSNGAKGYGGYDIVVSNYSNNNFKTPVNIGATINSSYNDLYYCINNVSNKASWVSNQPCKQNNYNTCCNDVWTHTIRKTKMRFNTTKLPNDSLSYYTQKLNALLPLTLYFHNDEPNPRTTDTITNLSYTQTYTAYNSLRNKYINEYNKGLVGVVKEQATANMQSFFDDYVTEGYNELQLFVSYLKKISLLQDSSLTVLMKGYCSPLASSDYNKKLAKRRIASLQNDLLKNDFIATLYTQNKLMFTQDNIGEDAADASISDNVRDIQKSVYAIKAATERRIQILRVK